MPFRALSFEEYFLQLQDKKFHAKLYRLQQERLHYIGPSFSSLRASITPPTQQKVRFKLPTEGVLSETSGIAPPPLLFQHPFAPYLQRMLRLKRKVPTPSPTHRLKSPTQKSLSTSPHQEVSSQSLSSPSLKPPLAPRFHATLTPPGTPSPGKFPLIPRLLLASSPSPILVDEWPQPPPTPRKR